MTEDRIEQVIELTRLATESALSEHILAKEGERPRVIVRHYPARWRVDEEGEPVREEECISVAIYFLDWLAWPQPCVVSEWRDTPRVTRGGDEDTIRASLTASRYAAYERTPKALTGAELKHRDKLMTMHQRCRRLMGRDTA